MSTLWVRLYIRPSLSGTKPSTCLRTPAVSTPDPDKFMRERVPIQLALQLPAQNRAKNINTCVGYRPAGGKKVYYGCHFDWRETPNALPILEDLTAYTLDRFDQELESASHWPALHIAAVLAHLS